MVADGGTGWGTESLWNFMQAHELRGSIVRYMNHLGNLR